MLDLSTAPTIRMKSEVSQKKKDKKPPFEIIFPPHNKLNDVEVVITSIRTCAKELNVSDLFIILITSNN